MPEVRTDLGGAPYMFGRATWCCSTLVAPSPASFAHGPSPGEKLIRYFPSIFSDLESPETNKIRKKRFSAS
jgi:hypothetical protein